MEIVLTVLVIALLGAVTVSAIVRMRSKDALKDMPLASASFDGFNQFFDPAAARAKELLDKKHEATVALPSAEGDPLKSGEITIDLDK